MPIQPPPQYVLALAWRHDELSAATRHCLAFLRRYRDRHSWINDSEVAPLTHDLRPSVVVSEIWGASHGKVRPCAG